MEGGSLLDTLFDKEVVEDGEDVEMLDVEEGELVEHISKTELEEGSDVGANQGNQESNGPNSRQKKKKKKKNKRKRGSTGPNVTNINRCMQALAERKSYLMYTAVGCLGVAALSDLIKEVEAIQACGGQKTTDGSRFRNGGGILWNIIKVRDPNAYKEIMKKGKEFEKQFKQQHQNKQEPEQRTEAASKSISLDANQVKDKPSDVVELTPHDESQHEVLTAGQKPASVHDRIRMPVTYDDDLLGGEHPKDELA